ncbi:glycoside hydrolase family 65 protein [Phytoactinopolyspora halotolerans]|uniref:Glycoside hydrolase family 65 protein n=1 Tax=Phytoactinopolyspora halotolerans TaxID=1981512 RepID=A0A6L9SCR1_9ACTN|nr:glycoside hydrolase family 65 protein [Phytoactinopolyspora halotolerans]NEE02799.1 glycoside hydrolase family 65 protein [Phytoactinopolyspora halotolerans]
MIREKGYPTEPWRIREAQLDLEVLAQSESVLGLSNGHIGLRANLDEGEPHGLPGTYLNSFYELRPLPHAEAGYGYPEEGQTLVNVTNGKLIRLLVDDEPFDVRYGELRSHERVLDMRQGTLERTVEWVSPAGRAVRVHSTRLVSFTQRSVAAICYEVEPLDGPARLTIQSGLVANEEVPIRKGDPRVAAVLREPLQSEQHLANGAGGLLVHRTKASGLRMAAAMTHQVEGPEETMVNTEAFPDWARTTIACVLEAGQRLRVVKLLAYGFSSQRSLPALRDQVGAAIAAARFTGWEGLCRDQRQFLDDYWDAADVRVDGDPEVQQAVRFGMFHVLQAGARNEMRPIPAKGLTGPGYDGHVFWDTEMFALPVLTYTKPQAAAQVLRWRHATLDLARERAHTLGLNGAAFPWRTIRGQETSGYWPAGTAAFHIGADIADATLRYIQATGDEAFEREVGVELLVETARLFRSLGHFDRHGDFHIDGVTGPDEYSAIANDNIYTNLMAQRNMLGAADAVARHPDVAEALGVDEDEAASWQEAARAMVVPFDEELGVHQQSEGFTRFQEWNFAETMPEDYPLLLTHPYFDLYRRQVCKQGDLILAMHWRGDAFTPEEKAANFRYYEARTVRDSSLSSCTQAVIAAETGHLELAHDYLGDAALTDLHDTHANTRDGVHLAALAGSWLALVAGFGGMRDHNGVLAFAPRLPSKIDRLDFSLIWQGLRLRVSVRPDEVTYFLREGEHEDGSRIEFLHHGEEHAVEVGKPVSLPIPEAPPAGPEPEQPPSREPVRRGAPRAGES